MKLSYLYLIVTALATIVSSCSNASDEIIFKDNFTDVQNTLVVLDSILQNSKGKDCQIIKSFIFNNDTVYVNNDSILIISNKDAYCNIANTTYKNLKTIFNKLRNNNITYAYIDNTTGATIFGDGNKVIESAYDTRQIVIDRADIKSELGLFSRIITQKGRLILITTRRTPINN